MAKKIKLSAKQPSRSHPTPARVMQLLTAYQATEALKAAIELDLFTAIDEGARTAAQVAERRGASERGVRILCDFLTIAGLLGKKAGRYALAPDAAAFLSRRSPAYLGSAAKFLASPELKAGFADLAEVVRRGERPDEGTVKAHNPVWVEFARSMAPMMAPTARALAQVLKETGKTAGLVLDIAAGHGLFGISVAQADPEARVIALDWPAVLAVAQENAGKAGVAERFQTLPGSAFEVDFGRRYDTVLLPNFLHHFDVPTNEALLRKVHASLARGGRVAVVEFVPAADRVSPPAAASFSLVMLGSTPRGDAYTHAELDAMLRRAGFRKSRLVPLAPTPQSAVLAERA